MTAKLVIKFDNEVNSFYPGQTIRGQVTLQNDQQVKMKGLTVTFYGEADVLWTEAEELTDTVDIVRRQNYSQRSSRPTRHLHKEYRNHETILCHQILLMGQEEPEGGTEIMLDPGTRKFRFQYLLPHNDFPPTLAGCPYGSIRYFAEARLIRPLFRYDITEKEFLVSGILDINCVPNIHCPVGSNERMNFGWFCCPEDYVSVDLQLEKTGYAPDEQIHFTVTVINFTNTLINQIFVTFTQSLQFSTFDRKKTTSSDLHTLVHQSPVEHGGIGRWNESFTVPITLPPTTLCGRRIIGFHYSIIADVHIPGSNKICRTVCPVIIGAQRTNCYHVLKTANSETIKTLERDTDSGLSGCVTDDQKLQSTEINLKNKEYDPSLNPFLNSECDE